jgi:hypothetical protein
MNNDLEINDLTIDTGLTIVLPTMIRSSNNYYPTRERVTGEKYFRQAIFVFNEEGKYVDSGFVQINDYTNMCKMIKVCNKSKKYTHLYERWEHYKTTFNKSNKFNITNMVTGNIIGELKNTDVPNYVSSINPDEACYVGDLEKDDYSELLLECLNEYSKPNAPSFAFVRNLQNSLNDTCCCNLLEVLDEEQIFKRTIICHCKKMTLKPELTEEQRFIRAELKLKAQAEILDVFSKL